MQASRWLRTAAVVAIALAPACAHNRVEPRAQASIPLVVRNDGIFDVTIYALPSPGSNARIRLGMVTGASTTSFVVPRRGLEPQGALVLMLHAIGAQSSWVTPSISVSEGMTAYLDIYASPSGDLSRSAFYAFATTAARDGSVP
jgi:hypothetical protein